MSERKAAGPMGSTCELLQAAGRVGIRELRNIFNNLLVREELPKDWKDSITIAIYEEKGDAMDCGNYRGVMLLEHGMKVYESVLEIDIGRYQFGLRQSHFYRETAARKI